MAHGLGSQDHFEILGLTRDATSAAAHEAFLKLAKVYHPDRLPEELADLKPLTTKIFTRLSEAHQTLSDPTKRQHYLNDKKHPDASDEDEKVRRILRAAGAFQKAEVLFKKRMLAAAELEVNRAIEDDPEQPDYLALYAWIQACKSDSEPRLGELLKMVSDAVTRNPANEKNRFYRVQILKRLGRIDEAVTDCRIIVDRNPHHVDAQREDPLVGDAPFSSKARRCPAGTRIETLEHRNPQ
ncbi:MAG: DnaJ domain-containing protein [Polyangiaceae bacterium]